MTDLPPLPEPVDDVRVDWRGEYELLRAAGNYYTADQMREYALAAIAAEREACAKVCDVLAIDVPFSDSESPTTSARRSGQGVAYVKAARLIRAR